MNRRSRVVRTTSALFVSMAAAVVFTGTAAAAPTPEVAAIPTIAASVLEASPIELQQAAATMGPDAVQAVANLLGVIEIPDLGITTPQPFIYPAPTLGCGIAGAPATVTVASAQGGPNFPIPPWINKGELRFQAIPGFVDIPKTSNLSVAWINLSTFKGGIVTLDDNLAGIPTLSKTVPTGSGPVLAAMFGGVSYASGANCFALPTVGSFTA
ncbi:hypothetical protein JGU71_02095 [Antrihabitans sp. YC3-6]|uniref:Secreted protein n=1 Tax=Antrihabitans stalagmiti TaxID=2799499 RepID=A0A934U0U1_9NOCA|nr:hypothetical protein [Antrihabitans stalagmiti]MBJ8337667.1 hypothetical protein [Antrihabitans stalagmiti]